MGDNIRQIDILITSTSRPELLAKTIKTMRNRLKFSGKFRWLLHEDCLNKDKSALVIHNAKYAGMFDKIIGNNPRIGLGRSIEVMLKYIKSPIFFRTDDDWEYIKDIDLDPLYDVFIQYKDVNQVVFNKYEIYGFKRDFIRESFLFNREIWLTITNYWNWIPALWRTDFSQKHYHTINNVSRIDVLRKLDGVLGKDMSIDWLRKNVGAYFFGKIGSYGTYIKHLGGNQRTLDNGGIFGIY